MGKGGEANLENGLTGNSMECVFFCGGNMRPEKLWNLDKVPFQPS
uniref:Uncharacterized protein n=1 Tax=Anguilla anguilla TaxID=7936 RepID=A0A0E9P7Z4_ANGAN